MTHPEDEKWVALRTEYLAAAEEPGDAAFVRTMRLILDLYNREVELENGQVVA